jgi:hypothetical protein
MAGLGLGDLLAVRFAVGAQQPAEVAFGNRFPQLGLVPKGIGHSGRLAQVSGVAARAKGAHGRPIIGSKPGSARFATALLLLTFHGAPLIA